MACAPVWIVFFPNFSLQSRYDGPQPALEHYLDWTGLLHDYYTHLYIGIYICFFCIYDTRKHLFNFRKILFYLLECSYSTFSLGGALQVRLYMHLHFFGLVYIFVYICCHGFHIYIGIYMNLLGTLNLSLADSTT